MRAFPIRFLSGGLLMALVSMPLMAETVMTRTPIRAPAALVWDAVRDVYRVHERLVPGLVTNVEQEGDDRLVTFANGVVIRERIVTIDDAAMRVAYSVYGGDIEHHMASMQVVADGEGCEFVWTSDFLPAHFRDYIEGNMIRANEIIARLMEAEAMRAARP